MVSVTVPAHWVGMSTESDFIKSAENFAFTSLPLERSSQREMLYTVFCGPSSVGVGAPRAQPVGAWSSGLDLSAFPSPHSLTTSSMRSHMSAVLSPTCRDVSQAPRVSGSPL